MNPAGQPRQATWDRARASPLTRRLSRFRRSRGWVRVRRRAHSDCQASLHALAQRLTGTGRLALQALLEQTRLPTWRLWARDPAIEFGRPKCWYRKVSDTDKTAETAWVRANVMGSGQAVWALRITAKDQHSDRCWGWGKRLDIALECAVDRSGGR